jgi:hypothetical protein
MVSWKVVRDHNGAIHENGHNPNTITVYNKDQATC